MRWIGSMLALLALGLGSGCDQLDGGSASCSCQAVAGRAMNTFKCSAPGLGPDEFICEKTADGLFCGQEGSGSETFSSEVSSCSPGFCVSGDGENCSASCGCSQ